MWSLAWGNLVAFGWNDLPVGREFDRKFLKKSQIPTLCPTSHPRRHYIDRCIKINKNKINLRNHEFVRKKQNGGWKLSDTDWFYFSFYNPSCFFFMIRVDPSPILFYFDFFIQSELVRVHPSWSDPEWRSELIRSDFCTCLIITAATNSTRQVKNTAEVWLAWNLQRFVL